MKLYVTPAQFAALQEAALRAEVTGDHSGLQRLVEALALDSAFFHGGDFNLDLALAGVETEVIVVWQ
jgi:hypothetical protein